MKVLPEEITASAFTAANGEYAWPRTQIVEAFRIIVETEQAILGGEVWAVKGGKIWGAIPDATGEISGVWHWETLPHNAQESWVDYCRRTGEESIRAVEDMRVEDDVSPEFQEHLFFNVTYIDEADDKVEW
jgi:hypothetical protein